MFSAKSCISRVGCAIAVQQAMAVGDWGENRFHARLCILCSCPK